MTAVCINILHQNLVKSETLPNIAMQTDAIRYQRSTYNSLNKALSLVHFRLCRWCRSANLTGQRLFCILSAHINHIFNGQMQTEVKSAAQGNNSTHTATADARNSVYSTVYQIEAHLIETYPTKGGERICRIIHTDLYKASNRTEAYGAALLSLRRNYCSTFSIDLQSIRLLKTYKILNSHDQSIQQEQAASCIDEQKVCHEEGGAADFGNFTGNFQEVPE